MSDRATLRASNRRGGYARELTLKVKARGRYLPRVEYVAKDDLDSMHWIEPQRRRQPQPDQGRRQPVALTGAGTYKVKLVVKGLMQDGE